jgi:hypothetical protein
MQVPLDETEEFEMPAADAVLAATLALMTGYGQALQAALNPEHRLLMGAKIVRNLALLADHPQLSAGLRQVLERLQQRWQSMSACTEADAPSRCACGPARDDGDGAHAWSTAALHRVH